MDRRNFCRALTGGGVLTWTLRAKLVVLGVGTGGEAFAEKVYDLVIDGYSVFDGQKLGRAGVLKATQIIAGKALAGLKYEQDDHGHTFDLTEAHLKDLLANKVVEVETTTMQDHKHKVRIEPTNKASNEGIEAPAAQPGSGSGTGTGTGTGTATTPDGPLSLVDQHCTECHHTGSGVPLDLTKAVPKDKVDGIIERVKSTDAKKVMPPGMRRPLNATEIEALKKLLGG